MQETEVVKLPLVGLQALQAHTFEHSFALLMFAAGVNSPDAGVDGGSGVGVRIGERYFVATAGHNLSGVADDGLVVVHQDRATDEVTPFLARWPRRGEGPVVPDVGYIELPLEVARNSPRRFGDLSVIRPYCRVAGVDVVVAGSPVARIPTDLMKKQRLINQRTVQIHTTTASLPNRRDPEVEFALVFSETSAELDTGRTFPSDHPRGISGAGVWGFPASKSSSIWSPSFAPLLGIETTFHRSDERIFCVHMRHWLVAVAQHYPDLQDLIKAHLEGHKKAVRALASDGADTPQVK